MSKIRVLIVEEAVVVRRLVANVLSADPGLEVAGTAASGAVALAKIPQVKLDLVLLGLALREVEGEDALTALRKAYPLLPVVLFGSPLPRVAEAGARYSRSDEEAAAATLRQL